MEKKYISQKGIFCFNRQTLHNYKLNNNHKIEEIKPRYVTLFQRISSHDNYALALLQSRQIETQIHLYDGDTIGKNCDVCVVDTGIDATHDEFMQDGVSRVKKLPNEPNPLPYGDSFHDGNDHGTHVAGIIGGNKIGWGKGVTLYACKALDDKGSGSNDTIITWLKAIKQFHIDKKNANIKRPTIVNMSLGGDGSEIENDMVTELYNEGIVIVCAAGNETTLMPMHLPIRTSDYLTTSPSASQYAICVGSTDNNNKVNTFSNWGARVDIYGSGGNIYSSVSTINGGDKYAVFSGTSMASPQITGIISTILSKYQPMTKEEIESVLKRHFWGGVFSPNWENNYNTISLNDKPTSIIEEGNSINVITPIDKFPIGKIPTKGNYVYVPVDFNWYDPKNGTKYDMGDDDMKQIDVNVTFYGKKYSKIYVCSNGFIAFDRYKSEFNNTELPSDIVKKSIFVLWDDFNPSNKTPNTGLYVENNNGTIIITWQNYKTYNGTDNNTFQVIINNNTITYQYLQIGNDYTSTSATVGLQDVNKYLQIHYDGINYTDFKLANNTSFSLVYDENALGNDGEQNTKNILAFSKVLDKEFDIQIKNILSNVH